MTASHADSLCDALGIDAHQEEVGIHDRVHSVVHDLCSTARTCAFTARTCVCACVCVCVRVQRALAACCWVRACSVLLCVRVQRALAACCCVCACSVLLCVRLQRAVVRAVVRAVACAQSARLRAHAITRVRHSRRTKDPSWCGSRRLSWGAAPHAACGDQRRARAREWTTQRHCWWAQTTCAEAGKHVGSARTETRAGMAWRGEARRGGVRGCVAGPRCGGAAHRASSTHSTVRTVPAVHEHGRVVEPGEEDDALLLEH